MFIKKTLPTLFALALLLVSATGCLVTQESQTTDFVDRQQDWYRLYQGPRFYTFSLERAVVLQIYDARNEARNTYSYSFSSFGNILFSCASKGFPIPYGVQLTNPERVEYRSSGAVLPQAEPNGLYSTGITTESTWYLCSRNVALAAGGTSVENAPVYSEPGVMSFPFPVQESNGRLYDIGDQASSINIDLNRPANIPVECPPGLVEGSICK